MAKHFFIYFKKYKNLYSYFCSPCLEFTSLLAFFSSGKNFRLPEGVTLVPVGGLHHSVVIRVQVEVVHRALVQRLGPGNGSCSSIFAIFCNSPNFSWNACFCKVCPGEDHVSAEAVLRLAKDQPSDAHRHPKDVDDVLAVTWKKEVKNENFFTKKWKVFPQNSTHKLPSTLGSP